MEEGKYSGQIPTKSTAFDGHMPSDLISKMLKIPRKNPIARECLANSIRRAHASIKRTMSRVQTFTNISVQSVPPKVKNIDMQPKTVAFLAQKTS